jgi:hypothetical protein
MADYQGPMFRAVRAALTAATLDDRDRGTAELCRRYAILIDNATPASKYKAPFDALRLAVEQAAGVDPDVKPAYDALDKIETALAEHTVASDLGPKLLAALTSLGLSVAGRAGKTSGGTPDVGAAPARTVEQPRSQRDEIRARRELRSG